MATKDAITCHVLDTLTGRPAAGMKVTLNFIGRAGITPMPMIAFRAETNSDGRIAKWEALGPDTSITVDSLLQTPNDGVLTTIWRLQFLTGDYYGEGKTFWPEVDLTFYVKSGEHYHVPLLLGPYSYTTYRGS